MSSTHNPFEESVHNANARESLTSVVHEAPADQTGVSAQPITTLRRAAPTEDPPWGGGAIIGLIATTLIGMVLADFSLSAVAHRFFLPKVPWTALTSRPEIIVGAQVLAYALVLVVMYRIAGARGDSPATGLCWNWPRVWPAFVGYGIALSIALQLLGHFLPMPKTVPMDKFFSTPMLASMISIFGISVAPLMEELFFRGFLYPVLARSFGTVASVLVTGVLFAGLHAEQLNRAWGPLLVIVVVGITLSIVRAYRKSVACTFLIHVGYNFFIMVMLFAGTDGFRHLDRLRQ